MKNIDTILFDIDGTLLDTEIYTISSKIIEGKKYGYNVKECDVIRALGMSKEASEKHYTSLYGENFPVKELSSKRIEYIYNALYNNEIKYKDGAKELIEYLVANNYKIALVSSSTKELIDEYKKRLDLFKYFHVIISVNDTKLGKPHPDPYLKGAEILNSLPQNCLVIEDSKNGILSAKNANMKSVFIEDLVKVDAEIKSNSTYILNNLKEIITLLNND